MALIICGIVFGPKIFGTSPGNVTGTPVPTEIAVNTETPTLPPSVTPTPVPSTTETPVPTERPTPTPTEEVTPPPTEEVTPTEEPTPEPTEEPTPTEEPLPTDSPTPVPTNTATPVPTKEPTNTVTPVPTKEPTKEPTKAPTNTPTNAPTPTEVVVEQPITMWIAVDDFYVYDRDVYYSTNPHRMQKIDNQGKKRGDTVVVIRRNIEGTSSGYVDEIQWGSGTALVWEDHLSKTYIEPVWPEPRERTDIANALARLIDNYRAQNGIRKVENPYIYYELDNPGIGDYLTSKALRVAKRCCMEGTANHEGGQIGTGIYGGAHDVPMNAEECANALFQNWYNSPAHRANLLDNKDADTLVLVGTVKVVEWYNGYGYQYCAIQGISYVEKAKLPDGLE
jgi:hypothetical protein